MASTESDKVPNGKAVEPSLDRPKTQLEQRKASKPRRGYFRWSLALIVRLFVWYTVLTPFFHCPSNISELNDSSPRVCKPYLIARTYIDPHIDPYYQAYAAPYIELARPYAQTFNDRVYTPVSNVAIHGYRAYGAPALAKAGEYGQQQWEAVVVPHLKSAQTKANKAYKNSIDPYVQKAIITTTPYTDVLSNKAAQLKEDYLLPIYIRSEPFLVRASTSSQDFLVRTVVPLAHRGWSSLVVFVRGNLLPSITGLYSENVEPQLVKIGERLASYREGRKLRTVVDEFESPSEASSIGTVISTPKSASETYATATASPTVPASETNVPSQEQQTQSSRERISSDLELWQEKFAAVADQGIDDLSDRIKHIVDSQLESGAKKYGVALVEALVTVKDHEISNIKTHINDLIGTMSLYDAPEEEDTANKDLLQFIRTAGIAIRDRAHALREWHSGFEQELARRVAAATDSTLDVLDGIRDLGLQEIGIRWAWTDGVTYKDWEKHHALRKQFDNWRDKVYQAGLQHGKVEEAKAVAGDLLSRGMAIAEDAAKELSRLKEVGKWKIKAREISENFEDRTEPPPPLPVPEDDVAEEDALESDDEPGFTDSSDAVQFDKSPISQTSVLEDVQSTVGRTTTVQIELAEETPPADDNISAYEAQTSAPDIITDESVTEESDEEPDSVEESSSTPSSGNKVWGGVAAQVVTNQRPIMDDVLDDEHGHFSEHVESLSREASELFVKATKAVSEALYGQTNALSFKDQAASIGHDQYFRALAAASNALYDTTASKGEHFVSAASDKYRQAVEAASSVLYATPTSSGTLESISAIASSRLQEGLNAASAQFASLTASIPPTHPTAAQNPIILDAQRRYYEAIGIAHDHYTAFISSASQAVFETETPTPAPSPEKVQAVLEEAISQFHQVSSLASSSFTAVLASASSAAANGGDSARSVINDAVSRYSNAMSAASASLSSASEYASSVIYGPTETASRTWEDLVSQASEQIYGTPTPFSQQLYNQQISRFKAVESYVSELVVGREPDFTESVMSKLRSAYETPYPEAALSSASSYVSEAYSSASSFVATQATPPAVLEDISKVGDHASKLQSDTATIVEEYGSGISSAVSKAKDEL